MKSDPNNFVLPYISQHGPINIAEYMELILDHSKHGYYRANSPIGIDGDFTTAPEVSQLFGELIGIWCIETWEALGRPENFSLVELGPGRGTLMADILRTASIWPEFQRAAQIHLIDKNSTLKKQQQKYLENIENVEWHNELPELPDCPLLIIANEFFDCLPIRQFVVTKRGWRERGVDTSESGNELRFVLLDGSIDKLSLPLWQSKRGQIGQIKEHAPERNSYMSRLANMLAKGAGRGLIIDYGYAQSCFGDTLQSVRNHRYADILALSGDRDVTAHVDFRALVDATRETQIESYGPITQREFLLNLGIELRAHKLRERATARQRQDINSGLDRLVSIDQMGSLFKVLAISSNGLGKPAGF